MFNIKKIKLKVLIIINKKWNYLVIFYLFCPHIIMHPYKLAQWVLAVNALEFEVCCYCFILLPILKWHEFPFCSHFIIFVQKPISWNLPNALSFTTVRVPFIRISNKTMPFWIIPFHITVKQCSSPEVNREFPEDFWPICNRMMSKIIVARSAMDVHGSPISQLVSYHNINFSQHNVLRTHQQER